MHYRTITFIFASLLLILVAGCQSGSNGAGPEQPSSTPAATDGPRAVVQNTVISEAAASVSGTLSTPAATKVPESTPTPAFTPTPAPDRTSCAAIQGTSYHSDQERDWYLANCMATPEPTSTPVPLPAIPGPQVPGERWILVDIGSQTATAMIGSAPLYTALVTTGTDDWETPTGTWEIVYRVENETMTSESIGADEYYVLEDVLYTQYFTTAGHALHLNYWRDDSYFGNTRSSHGCVGMRLADAEFFWNFASYGTRVTIQ